MTLLELHHENGHQSRWRQTETYEDLIGKETWACGVLLLLSIITNDHSCMRIRCRTPLINLLELRLSVIFYALASKMAVPVGPSEKYVKQQAQE